MFDDVPCDTCRSLLLNRQLRSIPPEYNKDHKRVLVDSLSGQIEINECSQHRAIRFDSMKAHEDVK